MRTSKTVDNVKHNYYYVDGQLRYEKNGDSYEIYYTYDADGRPVLATKRDLVAKKNYQYYLITNTRGDVIETRNGDGNVNAKFVYDAWGKLISVTDANGNALSTDSFAYQISLKYRGYVYDNETGLYYLQSRYYDPETGRFLNADDVDYIGASGTMLGYNAFAYCENNAVNNCDYAGKSSILVVVKLIALISALLTILSACSNQNSYGSAPEYKFFMARYDMNDDYIWRTYPNCYSYALGIYERSYSPGDISGKKEYDDKDINSLTLGNIVKSVYNDMKYLGRQIREIDSYDSRIAKNEYRIALRVHKNPKWIWTSDGWRVDWDYHFMVQTDKGTWAEKHGYRGATSNHETGNPDTISWDLGSRIGYYDSEIKYFAVT